MNFIVGVIQKEGSGGLVAVKSMKTIEYNSEVSVIVKKGFAIKVGASQAFIWYDTDYKK